MCKMAHFGNCDPKTKDQEYCIFHKPNKSEEEAREFYNKFMLRFFGYVLDIEKISKKKLGNFEYAPLSTAENVPSESKPITYYLAKFRFGKKIDAKGFVFPKLSKKVNLTTKTGEDFTFENAVFENHVSFYQAIFEGLVSFENAVFENHASFYHATFEGLVSFGNATFEKAVNFAHVKFLKFVRFNCANFNFDKALNSEIQIIKNNLTISNMHPPNESLLDDYARELPELMITFKHAQFNNGANFYNSKFRGITDFREIEVKVTNPHEVPPIELVQLFPPSITFERVSFSYVFFYNSRFLVGADFSNAEFEEVVFSNCIFGKTNEIVKKAMTFFWGSKFKGKAIFVKDQFTGEANFKEAIFNEQTVFEDVEFSESNTYFNKAKFSETTFQNVQFGEVTFNDGVHFSGKTGFWKCTFKKRAEFYGTKFEGEETSFAKSVFRETAHFDSAEFRKVFFNFAVFEKGASFNNTTFKGTLQFNESTVVGAIEFRNAMFEERAEFIRDKFRDSITFLKSQFKGDAIFDWSLFEGLVELTADYHGNVSFRRSTFYLGVQIDWKNIVVKKIEAKKELMRVYIMTLRQEGRIREASRLAVEFKKELNRHQRKKGSLREKVIAYLEWIFLELPSEYLTNWRRTIISSMVIILIFGILFCAGGVAGYGGIKTDTNKTASNILNYFYFSAVTFTTLGYGDFHPVGIVKVLASIEAFLGVLYAAMISAILGKEIFVEKFEE